MSLYKRKDSPHWWVKFSHSGTTVQRGTGTSDRHQAQEYHDKLKASLWEQQRLGVKPRRAWKEAVIRWLAETSEKVTHQEDVRKLRWLDPFLGSLMLDEITLDVLSAIKAEKLKIAGKPTVNRYLALVRAILLVCWALDQRGRVRLPSWQSDRTVQPGLPLGFEARPEVYGAWDPRWSSLCQNGYKRCHRGKRALARKECEDHV